MNQSIAVTVDKSIAHMCMNVLPISNHSITLSKAQVSLQYVRKIVFIKNVNSRQHQEPMKKVWGTFSWAPDSIHS